jgi:hypothetical protein
LLRDEENASLKKGLEFLLGRLVPTSCSLDERRHHAQVCDSINSRDGPRELRGNRFQEGASMHGRLESIFHRKNC